MKNLMISSAEFLKEKGLDIEDYVIHDISGKYKASIPISTWLIEFAKLHVQEALRQAVIEVEFVDNDPDTHMINDNSILTAYPLTQIK